MTHAQLKKAVDAAEEARIVVDEKLTKPTIWNQEEGHDLNNPGTNTIARSGVVITVNNPDDDISKKGKFDEHKMHKGDTFSSVAPELVPLVAGIANMSQEQMQQLQDKLPANVFQEILTIWNVNHDQKDIAKRDQAMVESFLRLTSDLDMETLKTAHSELFKLLGQLSEMDNARQLSAAIVKLTPEQLKNIFPTPDPAQQRSGPQGTGTGGETGADKSQRAASTELEQTIIKYRTADVYVEKLKGTPDGADSITETIPKSELKAQPGDNDTRLRVYQNTLTQDAINSPSVLVKRVASFAEFIVNATGGKVTQEEAQRLSEKYHIGIIKHMPNLVVPPNFTILPRDGAEVTPTPTTTPPSSGPSEGAPPTKTPTPSSEGPSETTTPPSGAGEGATASPTTTQTPSGEGASGATSDPTRTPGEGAGGATSAPTTPPGEPNEPGYAKVVDFLQNKWEWFAGVFLLGGVGLGSRGRRSINRTIKQARNTNETAAEPSQGYPFYSKALNVHYKLVPGFTGSFDVRTGESLPGAALDKIWNESHDNARQLDRVITYFFSNKSLWARIKARLPRQEEKLAMVYRQLEALGIVTYEGAAGTATLDDTKNGNTLRHAQETLHDAFRPPPAAATPPTP